MTVAGGSGRGWRRAGGALADALVVPVVLAGALGTVALASAGSGGWWGRRGGEGVRADAKAARDAAQEAFYELDSTQREVQLAVETVRAAEDEATARRVLADLEAISGRVDQVTVNYLGALDAYNLDDEALDAGAATRARRQLEDVKGQLGSARAELNDFLQRLQPVLQRAEQQLMRVTPAVEQAKRALLQASNALDAVRGAGLRADDLAARLAELAPELGLLNEGPARHGVAPTLRRADEVKQRAEAIAADAGQLPERAREIDRRVASLRTRIQALETKAATVEPALSELRRRFSAACWQDLQRVSAQVAETGRAAERKLAEAARARDEQRWADATGAIGTVRALLDTADGSVVAVNDRLRQLNEVQHDPNREVERARFALRDAQRLAMAGRSAPDPRHAAPLDEAVARLDRAVATLDAAGWHPDYWHFLTELAGVRETAARVIGLIRGDLGGPR
ncbi:chromosome segregation ATPase [Kitasatospora sp. MAA19]|nr:chromosome segregation ATPase [Kitasatospora sp. MAA19]